MKVSNDVCLYRRSFACSFVCLFACLYACINVGFGSFRWSGRVVLMLPAGVRMFRILPVVRPRRLKYWMYLSMFGLFVRLLVVVCSFVRLFVRLFVCLHVRRHVTVSYTHLTLPTKRIV